MILFEKMKKWFNKNKKYVLISGTIILTVGSGIAYVIYKKGKVSFEDWVKIAPTEELREAYEKLRLGVFCKTGDKPLEMERIGRELGERGAKEWFEKHPESFNPNFRWTDANRWDRD